MVTISQLPQAHRLSDRLDAVTRAIAMIAAGATVAGFFLRDSNGNQLSVEVPVPSNAVSNLLTNAQSNLQDQLTALGVTA